MNKKRKELIISVTGVLLLLLSAVFCYQTVRDAIINNEKESIQNIAEVSSHSLKATLQGKVTSYMLHYLGIWQAKRV